MKGERGMGGNILEQQEKTTISSQYPVLGRTTQGTRIGRGKDVFWWDRSGRERQRRISLGRTPLMDWIVVATQIGCNTRELLRGILSGNIPEQDLSLSDGESQYIVVCPSSALPLLLCSVGLYEEQLKVVEVDGIEEMLQDPEQCHGTMLYIISRGLQEKYGLKAVLALGGIKEIEQ